MRVNDVMQREVKNVCKAIIRGGVNKIRNWTYGLCRKVHFQNRQIIVEDFSWSFRNENPNNYSKRKLPNLGFDHNYSL